MEYTGKCMTMCPIDEFNFRKQHKLIHPLEINDHENYQEVLIKNCVKQFHRSAAGETICDLNSLRPSEVLLSTTEYLLEVILRRSDFPFSAKYDFIFDRLRSVRQDAVIQRLQETDFKTCIILLQRCVRFYLYAAYKHQLEPNLKIDLHINRSHLSDCLKSLIQLYTTKALPSNETLDCPSITATYILLNLNSFDTVLSILKSYPKWLRTTPEVSLAIKIFIAYHIRNFIKINKTIQKFINLKSYLSLYALSTILNDLRNNVLLMLCHSHNSKQLSFDASDLCRWLALETTDSVLAVCKNFGLTVVNETSIKFSKDHKQLSTNTNTVYGCTVLKILRKLEGNQDLYEYLKKP